MLDRDEAEAWIAKRYGKIILDRYLAARKEKPNLTPQAVLREVIFATDAGSRSIDFGSLRFNSD